MTVIAKRVAKTAMPAPWIHQPEVIQPVISNALILLFWHAVMAMVVVPPVAIHSLTTTASPFAAILYLKWEKCVTAIARRPAIHPTLAPSPNWWVLRQPAQPNASLLISVPVLQEMAAAHRAAIALTIMIALPFAPII